MRKSHLYHSSTPQVRSPNPGEHVLTLSAFRSGPSTINYIGPMQRYRLKAMIYEGYGDPKQKELSLSYLIAAALQQSSTYL